MAFLAKSDLYLSILEEELTEITRSDDGLVTSALDAAEQEMKVYLNDSYDTDTIFGKTGSNRHAMLVRIGADVAIYYIVARVQAGQEIDDRKSRYDRALAWLKMVKKSETYPNLERRTKTAETKFFYGSNTKRSNHY